MQRDVGLPEHVLGGVTQSRSAPKDSAARSSVTRTPEPSTSRLSCGKASFVRREVGMTKSATISITR